MFDEPQKSGGIGANMERRDGIWQALKHRDPDDLRMAFTICVGLAQGIAFYFMFRSPVQWHWYITVSFLPLPFYLVREPTRRVAAVMVPWCTILLLLDSAQIFCGNPYPYFTWGADFCIVVTAYAGALLTLPGFVSWADGDGAFPEWRVSFRNFSRIFFASVIAGFFLALFFAALAIGAELAGIIGGSIAGAARWLLRNCVIVVFAVWGTAFYWTARSNRLLDVLERYILPVFSCLLPMLSLFTLTFVAALPVGVNRLWRGGYAGVILSTFLANGLCAFAAWRDGTADGGNLREPFSRPVNALVKISLVLLPVFCPLLVYTIGLRIGQYGWTVDRAISLAFDIAFGLWGFAWAFFLVSRWRKWPIFYGVVNRAAFPALGAVLILLSSPVCDVRRIVLNWRLEWLRESVGKGESIDFDWSYTARNLGIYGIRTLEELDAGGVSLVAEKLGPFASGGQANEIHREIAREVASIKKEYTMRNSHFGETYDQRQKEDFENFAGSAREAPVFGGELSPDERERLARACRKSLEPSKNRYGDGKWDVSFFYLEDMNGDGERDVLMGIENDIYLLREGHAFKLLGRKVKNDSRNDTQSLNKTAIAANEQKIIKNRWDMLQIRDWIFSLDLSDMNAIEPF
ncbi:MAG: DUF4153 domain-containing protein [Synergistaceae bacterium]|jgi:hypothetical protein|nr:DUF4153 domain-containing protein [Synergistaceae bacterium]